MDFTRFDRYFRYLLGAALLIVLLTYWRFREVGLSSVYSYVAQQDLVRPLPFAGLVSYRSLSWDFFGLVNRLASPHSILLLKVVGGVLTVVDLVMLSRLVNHIVGQKFWGFLSLFLVGLSPFAVVSATSGGSAAIAVAFALIFLMALYRKEFMYAGVVSALGFAVSLPGLIMLLIVVLELLQSVKERNVLIRSLLSASAGFFVTGLLIYLYSLYKGYPGVFFLPLGEVDLAWTATGLIPLLFVTLLNVGGILFLILEKRYDIYIRHFQALMLWIASVAFCIAQATTLNLFFAITVSSVLGMIFLHEFASSWSIKFVSLDTFILLFVTIFLFADLYANNTFVQDKVLSAAVQRDEVVNEVVGAILPIESGSRIVSNFAPAELAVKLGSPVVEAQSDLLGITDVHNPAGPTIFVVKRRANVDRLSSGCKILLSTSLIENKSGYVVEVIECGGEK